LFIALYSALSAMLTRLRREEGQTMAEYGILIAVIAIVVIVAAIFLGSSISSLFNNTGSHL
jgi:pilus assembly protein Flp/PilA